MPSAAHYRMFDTKTRDGTYVDFERKLVDDGDCSPSHFDCYDDEQKAAIRRGERNFVGIIAVAHCNVIRNGTGTTYTLESPGLWGVESNSGEEYLNEVYREQREELLNDILELAKFEVRSY